MFISLYIVLFIVISNIIAFLQLFNEILCITELLCKKFIEDFFVSFVNLYFIRNYVNYFILSFLIYFLIINNRYCIKKLKI